MNQQQMTPGPDNSRERDSVIEPDPLTLDVLHASGYLLTRELNALPPLTRAVVESATQMGGWPEVRIGRHGDAALVRIVIANLHDESTIELVRRNYQKC